MFFKIELAKEADAKVIFELSNDSLVRKNSFNSSFILWADHIKWFSKKIKDKNCIYYVVKDKNDSFIGQVRFDKLNGDDNVFIVGISLSERFRGKGLGMLVLEQATKKLLNQEGAKKVYAYIKKENQASVKSFLKAGYNIVGQETIKGFLSFKLLYEKN